MKVQIKRNKQPWPTKAVMEQVYEKHLWGGRDYDFYSGEGSHNPLVVQPYLNAVTDFLSSHHKALSICDLGCGDFNIGKHLVQHSNRYTAIDIVEQLIERNKRKFKEEHLEFVCLDIAKADLPSAECVILRQVLQHLSNKEIQNIVNKLYRYNYLLLTEHLPIADFIPNADLISGQGIRLKHQGGVDLLKEPFKLKVKSFKVLNEVVLDGDKGRITTTLFVL